MPHHGSSHDATTSTSGRTPPSAPMSVAPRPSLCRKPLSAIVAPSKPCVMESTPSPPVRPSTSDCVPTWTIIGGARESAVTTQALLGRHLGPERRITSVYHVRTQTAARCGRYHRNVADPIIQIVLALLHSRGQHKRARPCPVPCSPGTCRRMPRYYSRGQR